MKAISLFNFKSVMTLVAAVGALSVGLSTHAYANEVPAAIAAESEVNFFDELDPADPNIENILLEMDQDYQEATGKSPFQMPLPFYADTCQRQNCNVYIDVVKAEQKAYLYVNGGLQYEWSVSSGAKGHGTPNFDQKPNGRIYDKYTSRAYPGGDYDGLGNMPYAVFIKGGYAIHGTGRGNWKHLGRPASHGCIRLHPDNAKIFNRLVRTYGIDSTWIRVR